jgi:hypothetical protein
MLPRAIGLLATRNRPTWAHRAAHLFFAQAYDGPKVLYVYDDGDEPVQLCSELLAQDLVLVHHAPVLLPVKRNRMMRAAIVRDHTAIYFNWDDDDYNGPERLQRQVEALLAHPEADACVLCPLLWYDVPTHTLTRAMKLNLHGLRLRVFTDAAIAFRRRFWERSPWDEAVDPNACWRWCAEPHDVIIDTPGERDYVIVRHTANHMHDRRDTRFWVPVDDITVDDVQQLLDAQLPCGYGL